MQVKRYRAKTVKEAITKVRNTLGPEAMIISTKKLRGSGKDNGFEIEAVQEGNYTADENSNLMGDVKSELMSIKEMIYLLNHSGSVIEKLMMDPGILNLYAKLIRNGVNDHYVKMFMEKAGALNEHSPDSLNDMRRKIIKEIMQVIEIKDPFEARNTKRIIAAFIGTTGVGKTTTIAKLAARLMLMAKKTVALISIDNYRIGAVEQLKTYANILGIPIFPAFNRKDLLFALKRVEGKDFVLVDTAGQSQYDRSRIEELQKMITADLSISTHLLLSVTTRESEMNKAAINFRPLRFQSYIFTKLDEAERCGSIINQIMKSNLPISSSDKPRSSLQT